MLETLNDPDIRHMSIETPEIQPDALFDAERDITAEDWQNISTYFKALGVGDANLVFHLHALTDVQRILPSMKIYTWQRIKNVAAEKYSRPDSANYGLGMVPEISEAKVLFPDVKIVGLDEYKKSWLEIIHTLGKANDFYVAAARGLLELGYSKEEIGLDESRYNQLNQRLIEAEKTDDLNVYAVIGAGVRYFWPEKKLNLNEKMVDSLQSNLQVLKKGGNWIIFLRIAAAMQELNSPRGGELAPPQKPLPLSRNF